MTLSRPCRGCGPPTLPSTCRCRRYTAGNFVDGREHTFGQYAAAEILNHDFTVCFQDFRTIVEEAITAFIQRERVYEILLADDFRSDLNDV